jgi:hypothetical protein
MLLLPEAQRAPLLLLLLLLLRLHPARPRPLLPSPALQRQPGQATQQHPLPHLQGCVPCHRLLLLLVVVVHWGLHQHQPPLPLPLLPLRLLLQPERVWRLVGV